MDTQRLLVQSISFWIYGTCLAVGANVAANKAKPRCTLITAIKQGEFAALFVVGATFQ
jgi:hypothetical protein